MNNLEQLTRELGAALQLAPQYVRFVAADDARAADDSLTEQTQQFELVRMQYQNEAQKGADADDAQLEAYAAQFQQLHTTLMSNPIMAEYQHAAGELDDMVHRTIAIIGGCANGEDPATYEPRPKGGGCGGGGGCGSGGGCGGCH
ncbi:MAG: YlbF family regulator [Oscillospiraceae bacterium]|nr:YlbF family regulator [Oscillospiraceae bacterium]